MALFARQSSIPVILHLWQRLVEYGDPLLHQFLALAWLLSNRGVLLETPPEDVPKAVTGLRLQSAEIVDVVFSAAIALRRSTPRLFCDVLRKACYEVAEESAPELAGRGGGGASRVSLLGGLKATGIILADAGQVAEILSAQFPLMQNAAVDTFDPRGQSTAVLSAGDDAAAAEREDSSKGWGTGGDGGRFVLVDCRARDGTLPGADNIAASVHEKTASGGVSWRRIDPVGCFGNDSAAVAELLREFSGSCGAGGEENSPEGQCAGHTGPCHIDGESGVTVASGDSNATDGGACLDSGGRSGAAPATLAPSFTPSPSRQAAKTTTHVCFIGAGGDESVAPAGSWSSGATAAAAAAACPAYRLARAASRLLPRVCVLDGGFAALDDAIRRRGLEAPRKSESSGCAPGSSSREVGGADKSAWPPRRRHEETNGEASAPVGPLGDALGVGNTRASTPAPASNGDVVEQSGSGAGKALAAGQPSERPHSLAATASMSPGSASSKPAGPAGAGGAGVPMPPTPTTMSAYSFDRKLSRLTSNSRISEPFRVYAAKSADDMGRALRSLPVVAGKPLEVRAHGLGQHTAGFLRLVTGISPMPRPPWGT